MSGRFENKVAVVTGGASGIGRAAALRFCEEGARVVIGDYNTATGEATTEEAAALGHGDAFRFRRVDVAHEPDVEALMQMALDDFGRLDIVFNNAGVGGAVGPVTTTELDDWNYTVGILLTGVFLGIKHGARIMTDQGTGGAIVNTASVAGVGGGSGPHAYSACKAAVINLTRTTAAELAPASIRVNAVCPGAINTPLVNLGNAEAMASVFDGVQPWPRHGRPEDVASLVTYLASDEAQFITGEHVLVDGGLVASGPGLIHNLGGGMMGEIAGVSRGSTGEESVLRPLEG